MDFEKIAKSLDGYDGLWIFNKEARRMINRSKLRNMAKIPANRGLKKTQEPKSVDTEQPPKGEKNIPNESKPTDNGGGSGGFGQTMMAMSMMGGMGGNPPGNNYGPPAAPKPPGDGSGYGGRSMYGL